MKLVGVDHLAMRKFNELSAGQHQKVAVARGIVEETPILILDEPTSNLDVRHQVFVIEMLRALAEADDKLIVMISHDLNLAAKYAHKVVLMSAPGVIRDVGAPKDVITEEAVREVYGVECEVVSHGGKPLVILGSALPE
ncbi:MAG: ABC transporter ATP-binding protein [Thermoplasmata archaeon]|nr:ABC transporter ATP-binding protein [Thermoplasmata archaeon]